MKKTLLIAAVAALLPLTGAKAALPAYVSQDSLNDVIKVTAGGSTSLYYTGHPGGAANGLAFAKDGSLFVSSWSDSTITKINGETGVSTLFATIPDDPYYDATFLQALAFDNAGNLFVANGDNIIWKYTPGGVGSVFADLYTAEPGGVYATGLAFDAVGNLFVSDPWTGDILKIASDGTVDPTPYSNVGAGVYAKGADQLAFDADGNLFVSDYTSTIWKIAPGGGTATAWATGLNKPWGLAFDENGVLWGTEYAGGVISMFAADGTKTPVVTGVTGPNYIAFPVPEPSTYALCGLGALMVLVAYRRKVAMIA